MKWLLCVGSLLFLTAAFALAGTGSLKVIVRGIDFSQPDQRVILSLCKNQDCFDTLSANAPSPAGTQFPDRDAGQSAGESHTAEFVIPDLPAGDTYTVFGGLDENHDKDINAEKYFSGTRMEIDWPKEPFFLSGAPTSYPTGKPNFEDSKIEIQEGKLKVLNLTMFKPPFF